MNEKKLLAAAKAGNVDRILALTGCGAERGGDEDDAHGDAEDESDLDAYKWLLVAADFGHDVDDMLDALEIGSSLHYDDGQAVEGHIHFELGLAYLRGEEGLKIDHELAKEHLERAHEVKLHETTDITKTFPALRRKLKSDALAVFDAVFAARPAKKKPAKKNVAKKKTAKTKTAKTTRPRR